MQKHWSQIGLMVSIAITAVLILGFVGESMGLFGGGGGGSVNRVRTILCINSECGEQFGVEKDEFLEMHEKMLASGGAPSFGMSRIAQPRFECKFCGENTAFVATECEECGTVFVPDYSGETDDYPDTCPECGYSKTEEARP